MHDGDNLTGKSDGDDEVITINLGQVNQQIDSIWPVINIFSFDTNFNDVVGAYC